MSDAAPKRAFNEFSNGKREETPAPPAYQYTEYPACRYHKSGAMRLVHNAQQDAELGEGWSRTQVAEPAEQPAGEPAECVNCVELTIKIADTERRFQQAWSKRHDEFDARIAEFESLVASLQEQLAAQPAEHDTKRKKAS